MKNQLLRKILAEHCWKKIQLWRVNPHVPLLLHPLFGDLPIQREIFPCRKL